MLLEFACNVDGSAIASASLSFVGTRSSMAKPILSHVLIGITLIFAPVSRSPVIACQGFEFKLYLKTLVY